MQVKIPCNTLVCEFLQAGTWQTRDEEAGVLFERQEETIHTMGQKKMDDLHHLPFYANTHTNTY